MSARLNVRVTGVVCMRTLGILGILASVFFLALAYTMAFHGMYVDCFTAGPESAACGLRSYSEPNPISALYGTVLAAAAITTYHLGMEALWWLRNATAGSVPILDLY